MRRHLRIVAKLLGKKKKQTRTSMDIGHGGHDGSYIKAGL